MASNTGAGRRPADASASRAARRHIRCGRGSLHLQREDRMREANRRELLLRRRRSAGQSTPTEVNIQNINLVTAPVLKFVLPLINSDAVVAREPNVADPGGGPAWTPGSHQASPARGDDGRLLPHLRGSSWARPRAERLAHHRDPHDREPVRARRLRGLHGQPPERRRRQHRRRIPAVAASTPARPGLTAAPRRGAPAGLTPSG